MLRVTDLVLARGTKRLLDGANLTVHAGHKVGLVGPNGCGKSSLFALILRRAHQDAGNVEFPPSWTIAHVAQETPAIDDAGDRVRRWTATASCAQIERALAAAETAAATDPAGQGEALAHLHHRYDEVGGYSARARAATLLVGPRLPRVDATAIRSRDSPAAGGCGSISRRR